MKGEIHEKATNAAAKQWSLPTVSVEVVVKAYFAELERQGVRLVEQSEIVEWLRAEANIAERQGAVYSMTTLRDAAISLERRYGGGKNK